MCCIDFLEWSSDRHLLPSFLMEDTGTHRMVVGFLTLGCLTVSEYWWDTLKHYWCWCWVLYLLIVNTASNAHFLLNKGGCLKVWDIWRCLRGEMYCPGSSENQELRKQVRGIKITNLQAELQTTKGAFWTPVVFWKDFRAMPTHLHCCVHFLVLGAFWEVFKENKVTMATRTVTELQRGRDRTDNKG